jgi:predicted membrane chloride channel (bestrophin family)
MFEPDSKCIWIARLKVFDKLWHYQMQLTTFILTFFLTQAYSLWREMYATGRSIQGRISDIGYLLATNAQRRSNMLSTEAQDFLSVTARNLRLYHILVWASASRQFKVLLTNRGMKHLMERGFLTENELRTLMLLDLPAIQRHNAILEWIIIRCNQARKVGIIEDRQEVFAALLEKMSGLRGTASGIGGIVDGRMPLAYAHLVQVLVDTFLFFAPLALFSELGWLSIFCVAFMTFFYEGLLDLAKVFLDPLNNEDYCEGGIDMDLSVFVRESNAASVRWLHGAAILPFPSTNSTAEFVI